MLGYIVMDLWYFPYKMLDFKILNSKDLIKILLIFFKLCFIAITLYYLFSRFNTSNIYQLIVILISFSLLYIGLIAMVFPNQRKQILELLISKIKSYSNK
jgi:cbb3-type cytochrome oxidase subunit 3